MEGQTIQQVRDCFVSDSCVTADLVSKLQENPATDLNEVLAKLNDPNCGTTKDASGNYTVSNPSQFDACFPPSTASSAPLPDPSTSAYVPPKPPFNPDKTHLGVGVSWFQKSVGLPERPDLMMNSNGLANFMVNAEIRRKMNVSLPVVKNMNLQWALLLGAGKASYASTLSAPSSSTLEEKVRLSVGGEMGLTSTVSLGDWDSERLSIAFSHGLRIYLGGGGNVFTSQLESGEIGSTSICLDAACSESVDKETGGIPVSPTDSVELIGQWSNGGVGAYGVVGLQLGRYGVYWRPGIASLEYLWFPNPEQPESPDIRYKAINNNTFILGVDF